MPTRTTTLLPGLAAIAIVVVSGYLHGLWSFRWSAATEVRDATERLARVPSRIGDWVGTEAPLDDRQKRIARLDAVVSRRYANEKTGQTVTVLLVCGRPGPLSVHTPDVCYAGAGYGMIGRREKHSISFGAAKPAEFWQIQVEKTVADRRDAMVIDYGWFSGGEWTAPAVDARLKFAGYPVLYKMYVIREQPKPEASRTSDPGVDFLKVFLPEMQRIFDAPRA